MVCLPTSDGQLRGPKDSLFHKSLANQKSLHINSKNHGFNSKNDFIFEFLLLNKPILPVTIANLNRK